MVLGHGPAAAGPRYYPIEPVKLEYGRGCRHLTMPGRGGRARQWRFGVEFSHEQRPTADAGAGLVKAGNRGVRRARSRAGPVDRAGNAWPVNLRARCHDEPAADVGYSLRVAGRYVSRSCERWRARHPAGLFPGHERMPRIRLGRRQRPVSRADVAHRLPGRADSNRQKF